MANEIPLPPIKATEPGRNGRKHTVAQVRLNSEGEIEISLICIKPGCNCGGWYVLEDLLGHYQEIAKELTNKEEEKEKRAA
jgi:hypothetical protein